MPFVSAVPAHATEPAGTDLVGTLRADDGTVVSLPAAKTIVADTVNGVTTWHETYSVDVTPDLLNGPGGLPDPPDVGGILAPFVEIEPDPVDPGEPVSPGEIGAPDPVDVLPPADDPAAPVVGADLSGNVSDSDTAGGCESDGSYSVRSCITMNYYSYLTKNRWYIKLVSYDHQWIRMDNTVRWSDALARAGVLGYASSGKHYGDAVDKRIGTPVTGTTYVHKPYWVGVSIDVGGNGAYQGANNEITLKRGTRVWELVHSNAYKGARPPW